MKVRHTFHIRRYWLDHKTPQSVLDTLNYKMGLPGQHKYSVIPYVDIHYTGDSSKECSFMELKYSEWIYFREEISYDVEGDDGL